LTVGGHSEWKAAELVASYLAALERADLDGVLKLFIPDAVVHSPQYRQLPTAPRIPAFYFPDMGSPTTLRRGSPAANLRTCCTMKSVALG
jgi:ketosteroid isomerase-like protein